MAAAPHGAVLPWSPSGEALRKPCEAIGFHEQIQEVQQAIVLTVRSLIRSRLWGSGWAIRRATANNRRSLLAGGG